MLEMENTLAELKNTLGTERPALEDIFQQCLRITPIVMNIKAATPIARIFITYPGVP